MAKAAKLMGFNIEIETVKRGEFGVDFLARIYGPDVWFGDTNSCCDLQRHLAKLHVTTSLPPSIKPIDKLVQKCMGYSLSDPNTPILGPLSKAVLRDCVGRIVPELIGYNNKFEPDEQYPNTLAEWMLEYAERLDLDLVGFNMWLLKCFTDDDYLAPPLVREPRPPPAVKRTVVIDDQTHHPEGGPTEPLPVDQRRKRKPGLPTNRSASYKVRAKPGSDASR